MEIKINNKMESRQFSRCELRLEENPFHSVLSQPWGMIAIGGLVSSLHLAMCHQCETQSLVRHYFANTVALLWEDARNPELRKQLGESDSLSLAMQVISSPALIHSGPHRLVDLQVGLPSWCKEFFLRSGAVLAYPIAPHRAQMLGNQRVMGSFCPNCQSAVSSEYDRPHTTLVITNENCELELAPVPLVCRLAN